LVVFETRVIRVWGFGTSVGRLSESNPQWFSGCLATVLKVQFTLGVRDSSSWVP
jgi:hypothetical protein